MICLGLTLDLLGTPPILAEIDHARLPSLWATLMLGYLGVGAAMAWHFGRHGHGLGTSTAALACWPLLLGLVGRAPPNRDLELGGPIEPGPNRARIDACVAGLRHGAREEVCGELLDTAQLDKLAAALHRADHRLARIDRLLHETATQRPFRPGAEPGGPWEPFATDAGLQAAIARLRRAREHAARELEAVLAQLVSLRIQLGLFALAGESEPVRERLAELEARVAALAELSSIELAPEVSS
jgi:hypothetical protein